MKEELDTYLCNKFPEIFKNRHGKVEDTAMCWGFEHGDGWFNIICSACTLIQWHIDESVKKREKSLQINHAMRTGDVEKVAKALSSKGQVTDWFIEWAEEKLSKKEFEIVADACPQVVALQVKEKFGTLRFYYEGGDDFVKGVISMAESMSGVTCEVCGNPGTRNDSGWIRTTCEQHKSSSD